MIYNDKKIILLIQKSCLYKKVIKINFKYNGRAKGIWK